MLSGRSIICFSTIDWDFLWQIHQEIMSTLAVQGNRVLFVENTGIRAPSLRDLPRLGHRIRNWWRGTKGFRKERDNLFVYSPLILPFPYSRLARWLNRALILRALRRWMRAAGFHHPIVWTFLPTPLVRDLIRELDPAMTVYYCADDLAASSRHAQKIRRSETQLFREADLVFVTSEKLRERASRVTRKVSHVPSGVNFEQFNKVRTSADGIPEDLQRLPGPVVGYVGGIHRWVDQELLATLAARLPKVSFALVGPIQTDVSTVASYPNIHLLGRRAHTELPRYIKGFRVGIVPYQLSEYTANVFPLKMNEYLAMGIPVVSTDLPEVRRFNAEYGPVVSVARTAEEFATLLTQTTMDDSVEGSLRRIEVARQNSWDSRIARMSALIEEAMAARQDEVVGWEASLRRLYRVTRRRVARTALALLVGWLLMFHTSLVWWLAAPLRVAESPRRADMIVVLGGGVGESGVAGQGYEERVQYAVELWKEGYAPKILFESGTVYALKETQVMSALAAFLGVPPQAIWLDARPKSTYEMAQVTAEQLHKAGGSSVLLVSSPYHMRRVSLVFRKQAPDLTVTLTPILHSMFYDVSQGITLRHYRGILHEYLGIGYYFWKGYL